MTEPRQNCQQAGPGKGLCDHCAAGDYERCRYVIPVALQTEQLCLSSRARFEKWMIEKAKIVIGSSDPYPAALERRYWEVWQAALSAQDSGLPK